MGEVLKCVRFLSQRGHLEGLPLFSSVLCCGASLGCVVHKPLVRYSPLHNVEKCTAFFCPSSIVWLLRE